MAMEFSTTPAAMGLSVGVYLGASALSNYLQAQFPIALVGAKLSKFR